MQHRQTDRKKEQKTHIHKLSTWIAKDRSDTGRLNTRKNKQKTDLTKERQTERTT